MNKNSGWTGRSLANYKAIQAPIARKQGVLPQLEAAKTLTQAKKIVYGAKAKNTRMK